MGQCKTMSKSNEEAMRLALEALKKILIAHSEYGFTIKPVIKALEKALAKQEQGEPVAWYIREKDMLTRDANWVAEYPDMCEPLYTTPQQRPSLRDIKPLTDEQIDDAIWRSHKVESNYAGWITDQRRIWARAIEAAHGIRSSDFKE